MEFRKTERKKSGQWQEIKFCELKEGDTFRLFENDGTKVSDLGGNTEWVAKSEPKQDDMGNFYVKI